MPSDPSLFRTENRIQKNNKLLFFSDQQRQTAFEIMSDSRIRKIKEDDILSGTITRHKENDYKLDTTNNLNDYLTTLSLVVINEKDVSNVMSLRENHVQQSHEEVSMNLFKISAETD